MNRVNSLKPTGRTESNLSSLVDCCRLLKALAFKLDGRGKENMGKITFPNVHLVLVIK